MKRIRWIAVTFVVISIGFGVFTNCSDVRLAMRGVLPGIFASSGKSTFPLPLSKADELRVVFFVDMSVSMGFGLCREDFGSDSTDPSCSQTPNGSLGIRLGGGTDPMGNRFTIMETWINQIKAGSANPAAVKYLVVPFNGGQPEANRTYDILDFVDDTAALSIVGMLRQEQADQFDAYTELEDQMQAAGESNGLISMPQKFKMGTSAPSNRLDVVKTKISGEAAAIDNNNKSGIFEFVLISDGVPRPRTKNLKKAARSVWNLSGCAEKCGDKLDAFIDGYATEQEIRFCTGIPWVASQGFLVIPQCFQDKLESCYTAGGGTVVCEGIGGGYPGTTILDVVNSMKLTWGDPLKNTPNRIAVKVSDIRKTLENSAGINSRISLVWLYQVAPENTSDKENWLLRTDTMKIANRFKPLASAATPFSLFSIGNKMEAYHISSLWILNPTARFAASGQMKADSDADGLFDDEDSNPTNPRANGRCLDKITSQGVCSMTLNCNATWDIDGDGLNECEELILGTNGRDFDSDGDGIPDGLEVLYSYDPLHSDLLEDANGDGVQNIENFRHGLLPNQNPSQVPVNLQTIYRMKSVGATDTPGKPKTEIYEIELLNIPSFSVGASTGSQLFYSSTSITGTEVPVQVVGTPHIAGQSPLLILVRIDNKMHNGDVHWAYMILPIMTGQSAAGAIDLQLLKYFKGLDPQTEAP